MEEHETQAVETDLMEEAFEEQYQSEERFDETLAALYTVYHEAKSLTEQQAAQLHQLLIQPKEEMNLISYVHLMFLQGKQYEAAGNKNGARYCAMRMLWIKECLERPRKRKPRFLLFESYAFSEEELSFLVQYTDFLTAVYQDINKKLFLLTTALFIIAFALLAFALKLNILLAFVEALILGALNFLLQKRRMPDIFQKNQTDASAKYINEDLMEFDRIYRYN